MFGAIILPYLPRSLIERGLDEKAKKELIKIRGTTNIDKEFKDLMAASESSKAVKHPWVFLLKRQYRPQLTFAIAISFFQQLTGMNVIMFYAPILFKTIGFGAIASLMSAMIIGACNAVSALASIFTIDKFGRRTIFLEGGAQMLIYHVTVFFDIVFVKIFKLFLLIYYN